MQLSEKRQGMHGSRQVPQKHQSSGPGPELFGQPEELAGQGEAILCPQIFGTLRDLLDAGILADTYREFLRQTRQQLADIGEYHDLASIHSLGHTLRGTAGMLGANALAESARELEQQAAPGEWFESATLRLRADCNALEARLRMERVNL